MNIYRRCPENHQHIEENVTSKIDNASELSKDIVFGEISCSKGSNIAIYSSRSNSILKLLKSQFDSTLVQPHNYKEMFQISLSVIAMLSLANI